MKLDQFVSSNGCCEAAQAWCYQDGSILGTVWCKKLDCSAHCVRYLASNVSRSFALTVLMVRRDVQFDFLPPHGSLQVEHGTDILPHIQSLLNTTSDWGWKRIVVSQVNGARRSQKIGKPLLKIMSGAIGLSSKRPRLFLYLSLGP